MAIQSNFPNLKPSLMLDFANTKQLDSRITYTRASTASYYDGVTTAMAEQNLLTQSQTFDQSPWSVVNASRTANTTVAPDGTTTGDTLTASAVTGVPYITQSITVSAPFVYSVYVKAGTHSFVQLFDNHGVNAFATFNLSTGTVGNSGNGASASIVDAGGGWYRCVMSVPTASLTTTSIFIAPMPAGNSARFASGTYVGTETLILWGAQLEQRSAVTAYTATTTQAITNYIPKLQTAASGVARFDNNPTTGESLGLLIEESRTNLCLYSSDLSNAAWTKTNATVTSNTIVAPDGTLTGDKLVDDTTFGNHSALQGSITFANATSYTITIYAKAGEIGYIKIGRATGTALPSLPTAYFNLITATVLGSPNANWTNYSITDVGNGWRRCSATVLTTGSGTDGIAIFLTDSSGNTGFTGNNYNGAYIWGAQVELGSFATSYIPTVASQVTRAADAASMTGTNFSSWYNASEGTIYAEATAAPTVATSGFPVVYITDGNTAPAPQNTYYLDFQSGNARSLCFYSGSLVANLNLGAVTAGTSYKLAGAFQTNNFAASKSGGTAVTDSLGNLSNGQNQMVIGRDIYNGPYTNGTIKKIAYYPLRVTNAQLQALTS